MLSTFPYPSSQLQNQSPEREFWGEGDTCWVQPASYSETRPAYILSNASSRVLWVLVLWAKITVGSHLWVCPLQTSQILPQKGLQWVGKGRMTNVSDKATVCQWQMKCHWIHCLSSSSCERTCRRENGMNEKRVDVKEQEAQLWRPSGHCQRSVTGANFSWERDSTGWCVQEVAQVCLYTFLHLTNSVINSGLDWHSQCYSRFQDPDNSILALQNLREVMELPQTLWKRLYAQLHLADKGRCSNCGKRGVSYQRMSFILRFWQSIQKPLLRWGFVFLAGIQKY